MADSRQADRPAVFHRTKLGLMIHGIFVVLFVGMATNGIFLILLDPKVHPFIWWSTLLIVGFMYFYAAYMGMFVAGRWRNPSPPVVIGPDGLLDRNLTDRPIPWDAIAGVRIVRTGGRAPGTHLMFDVRPGHPATPRFKTFARVTTALNRAFRFPDHQVWCLGTEATPESLAAAIERYVPVGRD